MHELRRMVILGVAPLMVASIGRAQEAPKPGPEHEFLRKLEGTWDATVKFGEGESKGTMTYRMEMSGLWLVGDFQGSFFGQKFEGRGLDSYDVNKKKYVGVWVDSMTTAPMLSEGTYDKDKKTMTMTGEGPGMDGKLMKMKMVTEYKDNDNIVFTMSGPGKDGKDQTMMVITYKRKK
jgi:hypothetical protein